VSTLVLCCAGAQTTADLGAFWCASVVDNRHLFDATEIFADLGRHKKVNLIKLGFYMVLFFLFLYRFVMSLVANSFKRPKTTYG
jgi:hypothetical protein